MTDEKQSIDATVLWVIHFVVGDREYLMDFNQEVWEESLHMAKQAKMSNDDTINKPLDLVLGMVQLGIDGRELAKVRVIEWENVRVAGTDIDVPYQKEREVYLSMTRIEHLWVVPTEHAPTTMPTSR